MEEFSNELSSRIENIHTVFTIPIAGGIPVSESIVLSWIIMGIIVLLCMVFVRNLQVVPGKKQIVLEYIVSFFWNFYGDLLGEKGKRYIPYISTVAIYIAICNLMGLFGQSPPTRDINVTAALAFMSIVLIEFSGIREKGLTRWIKSFAQPVALIAPLNVMEIAIRPVSLCMRLFGNMLGGYVVMEMLRIIMPVLLPIPFSLFFDVFDGLIQTYVFTLLTSLFIKEALED